MTKFKSFLMKTLLKMSIEGTYLNIIKAIYYKPITNIILNGEKIESIPTNIKNKTRISAAATFIQHIFESPSHGNQQRKRNKSNPDWKEVKLSLFAGDVILHVENPKDTTRKLLKLINEFDKVAGYKINTQKYIAFLHTSNEMSEREIKETIPFTITLKRIKYLGINLLKETKHLCSENYKMLIK